MSVDIQIYSLLFTLIYGFIDYILYKVFYKYLILGSLFRKVVYNTFFMLCNVIIYFICIYYINGGIFHIYFFFSYIIGFILSLKMYMYIKCQFE